MITLNEIKAKSAEFGIHHSNVQRDYVFGWLLRGVYSASALKDILILKGGNCFRKAYFPNTRFSADLDFSTEAAVNEDFVREEFNKACRFVQENTGVVFDYERNRIQLQNEIDAKKRVFDVRLYFKNFEGNADHITISLSIDITEFDKIYLPTQVRNIIHPYSDGDACTGTVRCLKLEEMLANKLKCLLQRQHVPDVYDLVYSIFINRDIDVNRGEVMSTFLRKTIYDRGPGVAKQLLLDLPLAAFKDAWNRYIVTPVLGILDLDRAVEQFVVIINELFASYNAATTASFAFFPSRLRTPIMQAGEGKRLVRLTYDGVPRIVEPYSLTYKRRKDGHGEEYLYAYDRTGGQSSGPGIKSFINTKIQGLEVLEETFEPRHNIELAKAGEIADKAYFARPFGSGRPRTPRYAGTPRPGWEYTLQCAYCNRHFKRRTSGTTLRSHKNDYGSDCNGRYGIIIERNFVSY